ncbi:TspO/MBR family protein [Lentibacillus saliphilus]|uniref:TspO/MBR family protein n=1 Tax=Lentibacillus saliphilus TaxID=2737028 RepID=UPI001C2F421A|nr:TspO/MBR family protein [Lentibacillus saliphilus]
MQIKQNKWKLAATIAIPVVGGTIIGQFATQTAKHKYKKLKQPAFAPPAWVFPVAWTTLYTTMGIAKYTFDQRLKHHDLQRKGNIAYNTQLGLNFLWSFLYFRWNLRGTAFIEAAMMWSAITLTTYYFYQARKTSGHLMIPYISWVTFALGLNYATWQLNKEV